MFWITLAAAGNTPIGRILYRAMVEIPALAANGLTRGNVAIAIVVLMLAVLHLSAGDADPVRMVGLLAPDLAIWLTSLEIGAIIEAVAGFVAAWATLRRVNVPSALTAFIFRFAKRPERRAKRARRNRRGNCAFPANDDEDGEEIALAS
jgi:hypothetical protein